jgi:hypothetical protein
MYASRNLLNNSLILYGETGCEKSNSNLGSDPPADGKFIGPFIKNINFKE